MRLTAIVVTALLISAGCSKTSSNIPSDSADRSSRDSATTQAAVSEVKVEIVSLEQRNLVGRVYGSGWDMGNCAQITIRLTNTSKTKIIRFGGWHGVAELMDEHGNRFLPLKFPLGFELSFGIPDGNNLYQDDLNPHDVPLHPGKPYLFRLFFEPIPSSSTEARLSAPASALDGEGKITFRISVPKPPIPDRKAIDDKPPVPLVVQSESKKPDPPPARPKKSPSLSPREAALEGKWLAKWSANGHDYTIEWELRNNGTATGIRTQNGVALGNFQFKWYVADDILVTEIDKTAAQFRHRQIDANTFELTIISGVSVAPGQSRIMRFGRVL